MHKKMIRFCIVLLVGIVPLIFYINKQWKLEGEVYFSLNHFVKPDPGEFNETELLYRSCERKVHTRPIPLELKHRQFARKMLIRELCSDNTLGFSGNWATFNEIPNTELQNLIVDDRHKIIYCYVPKVACTEWKRIIIVLSESLKVDGVPYRSPSDIPIQLVHGNTVQFLNRYSKETMKQKLQQYKKFLFVRDPFVRLISAYRDKFEKENQGFYNNYAIHILRRFSNVLNPPKSAKESHAAGILPSFSDFIQYILSFPAQRYDLLNEHWKQVVHLCHPCQINYDFIGKMETLNEDAPHLLRILGVDNVVQFPPFRTNRTEKSWIKPWFSKIPTDWRRKLYQLYETDFKLFGYQDPEDLREKT